MLGFQPFETFQLLIETGGIDRTNTLLIRDTADSIKGVPSGPASPRGMPGTGR